MKVHLSRNHPAETPLKTDLRAADSPAIASHTGGAPEPLGPDESRQLEKCEDVLGRGLGTFFEVGQALLMIREAKLYRENYSNFQAYCHERWGMGRNYAWHLIGAAERVKLLPPDTKAPKPANEFQVRPFLKLEPEEFPKAWEQVISSAKNGKITPALLRGVAAKMTPNRPALKADGRKRKKANRLPKGCSVGGILVLLSEEKKAIERGNTDQVLEIIARIESELLGM